MIEIYILLAAMVIAALVAIEVRDLLAAAVALGLVGFSVAIIFLLLQAPDLAIVQIVVETLTVVFFAAVILRSTSVDSTIGQRRLRQMVLPLTAFAGFAVLFVVLAANVFRGLPGFGDPVMRVAAQYIATGLQLTGAANVVAAIILDFRAYDTLGEATVLFTAVLGVLTVVRRVGRKSAGEK
ncbi:MAG: hydrogen gas-evolving membrane-bound hydrogenase subunit E [bacterium]